MRVAVGSVWCMKAFSQPENSKAAERERKRRRDCFIVGKGVEGLKNGRLAGNATGRRHPKCGK